MYSLLKCNKCGETNYYNDPVLLQKQKCNDCEQEFEVWEF